MIKLRELNVDTNSDAICLRVLDLVFSVSL